MKPLRARVERDFLGEREIPAGSYWGVHTARALENFSVSGTPVSVHRELVAALGAVKQAAVRANRDLGLIDERRADAIDRACQDVRDGLLDDQFVVDVIQGGAGTSTNMNTNEVVANRALELLGLPAGTLRRGASARPREPEPEHQRRLSDGGEAEPARGARRSVHRRPRPRRGVQGEVPRVLVGAQGGPHPAAGRGPDDGRAGVRRVGRDPGRGGGPHPRHAGTAPRDQPRRDRDRHRHHRRSRLPRGGLPSAAGDHRTGAGHRAGPDRGHLRRRRLRPALRRAQEDRGQGLQDLQRPQAAVLGPPGRLR